MSKAPNAVRAMAHSKKETSSASRKAGIAAALRTLAEIEPVNSKAADVVKLLSGWLKDTSQYDEKTWPKLKKCLDDERARKR